MPDRLHRLLRRRLPVFGLALLVAAAVAAGAVAGPAGKPVKPPQPPADTTRPTTPTGLRVTRVTRTQIRIEWTASTDNVGVAGYDLFVDGKSDDSTRATHARFDGFDCGTTHTLGVAAFDAAGNHSARATIDATTLACPDRKPPSRPSGLTVTGTTRTSISIAWTASTDNVGVTGYDLFLDGAAAGGSATTTATFDGLQCGTRHVLGVAAHDAAGNHSRTAGITASAAACPDTTPPAKPSGLTVTATAQTSITITWTASADSAGVTGYDLFLDGAPAGGSNTATATFNGLACGTHHVLGVAAHDAAGNHSDTATLGASTSACPGEAGVYVATTGSDANDCSQSSPCLTFDRAYQEASPGMTVEIAAGEYGSQTIQPDPTKTSTEPVVFAPAPGAAVTLSSGNGELVVYASHVVFHQLTVDDWYVRAGADGVSFVDVTAICCFFIDGASNVSAIGGSAGPADDLSNQITSYDWRTDTWATAPRNILIDGMTIHGYHQTDGSSHVDCIHFMAGDGITVRNSHFSDCEHFDILFTMFGDAGSPTNITIENNFFDCCRSGYFSVYLGDQHGESWSNVLVRFNSSDKPMGVGPDNTIAGPVVFDSNVVPMIDCSRAGVTIDYNVFTDDTSPAPCGPHDLSAPSGFVDAAGLDFHLLPGAAAIGHGNPASPPPADIDGQPRPAGSAPDAGADQR
jgi:chitodextrinase